MGHLTQALNGVSLDHRARANQLCAGHVVYEEVEVLRGPW
jgi:hypothetical protein